jgi:hypothetical protein
MWFRNAGNTPVRAWPETRLRGNEPYEAHLAMHSLARFICAAAAVLIAAALLGCGGAAAKAPDRVIVRVGNSTITAAELEHWMVFFAPGRIVLEPPEFRGCVEHLEAIGTPAIRPVLRRRCEGEYQTLNQDITDVLISWQWQIGEATDEGLHVSSQEVSRWLANGAHAMIRGTHATPADYRLVARAGLASVKIRQALASHQPKVSQAEIAGYYRRRFEHYGNPPRHGTTQVRRSIAASLAHERWVRALRIFIIAWRRKWTAKTDCQPGFVVQKCRQYRGPRFPGDPLALN